MAKKRSPTTKTITNKRASFDYELKDSLIAGIVLNGPETKSLRLGHGHLRGAFCTIKDNELWLNNATIMPTISNSAAFDPNSQTRARKLLVSKKQLSELIKGKDQGMSIIPKKLLTNGRFIKVEIALGKGRKQYDKRQLIKKRDESRELQRQFKV
jgi:SsrA-binding protein